jgi:hypothetical protein
VRLRKLTSYTELNATLVRRTGLPGFDFSRADERAAMGHLLYLIVELNRPETNLMISALVSYLELAATIVKALAHLGSVVDPDLALRHVSHYCTVQPGQAVTP